MIITGIIFFMILSYFLGSIPSGLLIGKIFKNIDIRQYGSKNMGATNAIRVLGFRYGVFAFVFDALKGALVMIILAVFQLADFYLLTVNGNVLDITILYGMVAVLGHVFPIYIHFKGGKAVATSAGMIIAIEPFVALIAISIFFAMFKKIRYVSISSTTAATIAVILFVIRVPILVLTTSWINMLRFIFTKPGATLQTYVLEMGVVIALAVLILIRHRKNYQRLREGTEHRF